MNWSKTAGDAETRLEVHVPISANAHFATMAQYLIRSLRHFGGRYANARAILTVGDADPDPEFASSIPWLDELRVEVRAVAPDRFARDDYFATAVERFTHPFDSDLVLMLDADTLVCGPLDELVETAAASRALCGLIAHRPPFAEFDTWSLLFRHCGLGPVDPTHEHTGWGYVFADRALRFCPPYFNLGVLCAPKSVMQTIGESIYDAMHRVDDVVATPFKCQVALTVSILAAAIPTLSLPLRYNMPNDMRMEAMYPGEWSNAAIVHLLADTQGVSKTRLFRSRSDIDAFLNRTDLRCTNAVAQRVIAAVDPLVRACDGLVPVRYRLPAKPSEKSIPLPPTLRQRVWRRVRRRMLTALGERGAYA